MAVMVLATTLINSGLWRSTSLNDVVRKLISFVEKSEGSVSPLILKSLGYDVTQVHEYHVIFL